MLTVQEARGGPPAAWPGRITAGSARKPRPRMGQRVVGGFRRTDRAGGGSAWRGSVDGPDRLGGGRFVGELQVADVAELPRIRFA